MRKYLALLAVLATLVSTAVRAVSFDCAQANSRVDNAICTSPQISKLDDELAEAYRTALASSSEPDAIKTAQRLWLKQIRNACQDEACLATVYQQRIAAIVGDAVSNAQSAIPAPVNTEQDREDASAVAYAMAAEQAASAASDARAAAAASANPVQVVPAAQAALPESEARTSANAGTAFKLASSAASQGETTKDRGSIAFAVLVLILAVLSGAATWHIARKGNATRVMSIGRGVLVSAAVFVAGGICIEAIFGSAPASSPAVAHSVPSLDARLTGKWTTNQNAAPACPAMSVAGYTVRSANGQTDFIGDDGAVIASRTIRMVKAYDEDVGVATVTSSDQEPIYWVVQFASNQSMTTMRVAAMPDSRTAALEKLDGRSKPDFPDDFPSVQYRCDTATVPPVATAPASPNNEPVVRRTIPPCEPTEGKNTTGGCARYVDIPNDGRFLATPEGRTSESGEPLVTFRFDSDVRTALRSATVRCTEPKSPDESATYELDFGLPGMRLAAYYALPNFRNYAFIRGSSDRSGAIPAKSAPLLTTPAGVACRVVAVVVASDAEVDAVQADLHALSNENAKAEADRPDPLDQLESAYAAFDARCRQAAGANTLELIAQMRKLRRMGARPMQGIGSVEGQLAMLRNIGCAPR